MTVFSAPFGWPRFLITGGSLSFFTPALLYTSVNRTTFDTCQWPFHGTRKAADKHA